MEKSEFDLSLYRQTLAKKAALVYELMSEFEADNSVNADLKSKTIEVLSAYSRSINFKLNKTYEKKERDTLHDGPEVIY